MWWNLDGESARQTSFPIDGLTGTGVWFVRRSRDEGALHFDLRAQQIFPPVPARVPIDAQNIGIKPESKLATHVTAQNLIQIKVAITQKQSKFAMDLIWHECQNAASKERLALGGELASNQEQSNSAIRKGGWSLVVGEESIVVGS